MTSRSPSSSGRAAHPVASRYCRPTYVAPQSAPSPRLRAVVGDAARTTRCVDDQIGVHHIRSDPDSGGACALDHHLGDVPGDDAHAAVQWRRGAASRARTPSGGSAAPQRDCCAPASSPPRRLPRAKRPVHQAFHRSARRPPGRESCGRAETASLPCVAIRLAPVGRGRGRPRRPPAPGEPARWR